MYDIAALMLVFIHGHQATEQHFYILHTKGLASADKVNVSIQMLY